jgi:glucan endo-1,3-alpha-glucosidase
MYRDNSDAFALNVGREDWQRARVADAYAAALQLQTGFKLFLSLDMT